MSATDIRKIINLLESIVDETVDQIEISHSEGPDKPFDSGTAFDARDRRLLQKSDYFEKIRNAFKRTRHVFDLYFINHNRFDAGDDMIPYVITKVSDMNKQQKLSYGIHKEYVLHANDNLFFNKKQTKYYGSVGKITVLMLGNVSDFRIPLTPWMIAHKIAHALCDSDGFSFGSHAPDFEKYVKELNRIVNRTGVLVQEYPNFNLLTTKTGKSRNIEGVSTRHTDTEGLVEMVSQYLITGRTTFNTQGLSEELKHKILEYQTQLNTVLDQTFDLMATGGYIVVTA